MKYIKLGFYTVLLCCLILATVFIYKSTFEVSTLQSNELEKSLSNLYDMEYVSDSFIIESEVESSSLIVETIPEHKYVDGIIQCNSSLEIKSQPTYSGSVLGIIRNNDKVSIFYESEDWTKIQSGKVIGYIETKYIVSGEEATSLLEQYCSEFVKSNVSLLRLYSDSNIESPMITLLSNNVEYPVQEQINGFYKVIVDSDLTGYVKVSDAKLIKKYSEAQSNEELQLAKEQEEKLLADAQKAYNALISLQNRSHTDSEKEVVVRTAMVAFAKQYLGNPYVWGGTSLTNGIDCSAYVRAVYDHVGIKLLRTTREQIKQGREITIQEVKPGDLFFYAYSNGYVHHVAMYIGNGELIHAAGKDYGIIISPMDYREPYKIKTYLN